MNRLFLALFAFLPVYDFASANEPVPRESIEWCDIWITGANRSDLPRVLLVGDSIVKGYYGTVEKYLAGRAYVARYATSRCVGDPVLLAELTLVLEQTAFDVIHFNNGLHGWANSEEKYSRGLDDFLALIRSKAKGASLVWARSTPVREAKNLPVYDARNERVKARNRIATEKMRQASIPENDLYTAVDGHLDYYRDDGIHYNEAGVKVQGEQVAAVVARYLGARR